MTSSQLWYFDQLAPLLEGGSGGGGGGGGSGYLRGVSRGCCIGTMVCQLEMLTTYKGVIIWKKDISYN